jgi:transcriptional regulator
MAKLTTVSTGSGMTFDEIAEAMGTTRQNVWYIYVRAMNKLRARPETLRKLQKISEALDKERNGRQRAAGTVQSLQN